MSIAPDSQNSPAASQTYYLPAVNLWNTPQHNSPLNDKWETFIQDKNIKSLLAFEGDRIYQGRKGNGIRFGSTVKRFSNVNEWSSIGNDGDPIMILVNGYVTDNPNKTTKPDKLGNSDVIIEEVFVVGFLADKDEDNILNYNPNEFEQYSFQRMDNNEVVSTAAVMKELQKKYNQRKYEAEKFNKAMDDETRKFHESIPQQKVYW